MTADNFAISDEMTRLNLIIANYDHADVWNAVEFGLFYRQPLSRKLVTGPVSGFQKEKVQMYFLDCCNNEGSERIPLMMIGDALRLRPFAKRQGSSWALNIIQTKKLG